MVSRTSAADSHPIHLHQIKFEVIKRCDSDKVNDPACERGAGVLGSETGYKDAVIAYPNVDLEGDPNTNATGPVGRSTFIRMKFDFLGVYGKIQSLATFFILLFNMQFYIRPCSSLFSHTLPQFGIVTSSLTKITK